MNYRTMLLTRLRDLADGTASYWPARTVLRVRRMFARLRIDAAELVDRARAEQLLLDQTSAVRSLTARDRVNLRELVDLALARPHSTPSVYTSEWMREHRDVLREHREVLREHREVLFGSFTFTFTVDLVATPAEPERSSSTQALCDAARRLVSEAGLHELWGAAALLEGYDKAWWQARQHELIASAGKGSPSSGV